MFRNRYWLMMPWRRLPLKGRYFAEILSEPLFVNDWGCPWQGETGTNEPTALFPFCSMHDYSNSNL